jgi:murein DD-endopeptidase MepM/ murein hydrolase activator NlpD
MATAAQRNRSAARRLAGVVLAFLLLGLLAAPAGASGPKERLAEAKARFAQLQKEIDQQQQVLDRLSAEAAALSVKVQDAQAQLELITQQLNQTRTDLDAAKARYEELQTQLNDRLRETYMNGPAGGLEFVLGAESWADLSDRMEYVNALAETDNDLATQVENLRNDLSAKAHAQQRLQEKQANLLQGLQQDLAAMNAKFDEAKRVNDELLRKKAEARKLYETRLKQYKQYLQTVQTTLSSVPVSSNGVFRACPVGQPRAVTDTFGAPRYAGGYHPHAGNDIMAPMGTPIYAPFDGTAHASYNGLGGNAVYVYGAQGYVYNAHLSSYSSSSNGSVQAGDVIGYVGNTGDALGGPTHDHFEWHPNVTPSPGSWPSSPYGYSVIDTGYGTPAVNPYPLLAQVC